MVTKRAIVPTAESDSMDFMMSSQRVDWHRTHDAFNLISLPLICSVNGLYIILGGDALLWLQFSLFSLYLLADSIWVVIRPQSVASPSTIIFHHVVCIIGWIVPHVCDPSLSKWTSIGIVVEINTFLMIARRYYGRTIFLQVLFYTSWVLLRLILFPTVLYLFIFKYIEYSINDSQNNYFNTGLFVLLTMIFLNVLNLKWSWDLFLKSKSISSKGQRGL